MIVIKDLSYRYTDGTLALDSINLELEAKSKIAIIGPNGAGKSTLVRIINGTLEGDGEIEVNKIKISRKNRQQLHKDIGVVFQNPDDQLFCPTIYDDVAFGPVNLGFATNEVETCVKNALAEVGLMGFENRSSFHLSYGERKCASIATVIAMQPEVYIFDEPSSNLDPFHRRKIIDFIKNLQKTVLIATHDLDLVLETCDSVILLNRGKLIGKGGLELLKDEKLLLQNQLELPLRFQK